MEAPACRIEATQSRLYKMMIKEVICVTKPPERSNPSSDCGTPREESALHLSRRYLIFQDNGQGDFTGRKEEKNEFILREQDSYVFCLNRSLNSSLLQRLRLCGCGQFTMSFDPLTPPFGHSRSRLYRAVSCFRYKTSPCPDPLDSSWRILQWLFVTCFLKQNLCADEVHNIRGGTATICPQ